MMKNAKIFYQDVSEGDELNQFEVTISRTHIVRMAGAGGDFNPLHHDDEFAKSVGLPSLFSMGLLQGGMLSKVVTDWAGDGVVKRYKINFKGMVWPNNKLTFKGRVSKKYQVDEENLVDCELLVVGQDGDVKILGNATVSLPTK
jgi:acyl dehydratase